MIYEILSCFDLIINYFYIGFKIYNLIKCLIGIDFTIDHYNIKKIFIILIFYKIYFILLLINKFKYFLIKKYIN